MKQGGIKWCHLAVLFLAVLFIVPSSSITAQEELIFTRKFTKKLKRHQIEFFHPVERWLKLSDKTKDEFLTYDLILHSPPDVELRMIIDRDHSRLFPNVEIVRTMAHISSNADDALIEYTQYPKRQAWERYGADLVLYADFTPKRSYTTFPNGRVLVLYREGEALIKCIILYEQELDPYFKLPMRFTVMNN